MIVTYIIALWLAYKNTNNVFSYQFISVTLLFPAIIAAPLEVQNIICSGLIAQTIGSYTFNKINGVKIKKVNEAYKNKKILLGYECNEKLNIKIVIISIVLIIISTIYFSSVGISLFAEEVGLARLVNRHQISGSYLYQRLFRVGLPIICMMYFLLQWTERGMHIYKQNIFILITITTTLLLLFTGIRGNVITFLVIPFAMMMSSIKINDKGIKQIIYIIIGLLIAFILVTSLMSPELDLFDLFLLIGERLAGGATDGITYAVLYDIPNNGLYYGRTYLNDLSSLLYKIGLVNTIENNYSAYIASELLGNNYNGEQAAVTVYGEFYANFGYTGVIIFSFILGNFIQYIQVRWLLDKKTITRVAFYAFFSSNLLMIFGGPTLPMLIDYMTTLVIFLLIYKIILSKNFIDKIRLKI